MKHKQLVVQIIHIPSYNQWFIKIIKQTHRGAGFGEKGSHNEFRASNGFRLVSSSAPQLSNTALFVRGDVGSMDNTVLRYEERDSHRTIKKLTRAVLEYNRKYSRSRANLSIKNQLIKVTKAVIS